MSFFKDISSNVEKAQEKYLGPTYPYHKNVKNPKQLRMGDRGTLPQLGRNIKGLIGYVEILVAGTGDASATGEPLGNKFFLKTGGKCLADGQEKERYIYINNVPMGNIPLISSAMGANLKTFRGLVPGTMSNLNALNPMQFVTAFTTGAKPKCRALTMETINNSNAKSRQTQYVADVDIRQIDPCAFPNRKNPVSGAGCSEFFSSIKDSEGDASLPSDFWGQVYFALLGLLFIYIIYAICLKSRSKSK
jgi:hypothetical protein